MYQQSNTKQTVVGVDPGIHTGCAVLAIIDSLVVLECLLKLSGDRTLIAKQILETIEKFKRSTEELRIYVEEANIRGSASMKKHGAFVNRVYGEYIHGFLTGHGYSVTMITPMRWKGNTPKSVKAGKLLDRYTVQRFVPPNDLEKLRAGKKSRWEDPVDALGIADYGVRFPVNVLDSKRIPA